MADFKPEDKGDFKPEDKGDLKPEDKGLDGLLGSASPFAAGGGWVVVSFIGPAGLDVRRLAAAVLLGRSGLKARNTSTALGKAAADALKAIRKREANQERLIKAAVQGKKLSQKRIGLRKALAKT